MKFTPAAFGAVLALAASGACSALTVDELRAAPNVIIMQPDDLKFFERWTPPAHLGGSGAVNFPNNDDPDSLPNLESLRTSVGGSVQMMRAYAASPKCGPSRLSTMTGRYASKSAYSRNKNVGEDVSFVTIGTSKLSDISNLADGNDCGSNNLAQLFKSEGYHTGFVGKWHLTKGKGVTYSEMQGLIQACGFTYTEAVYEDNMFGGEPFHHNMEWVTARAIEHIESTPTGVDREPFFLYANPTVPHSPDVIEALVDGDCLVSPEFPDTAAARHPADDPLHYIAGMTAAYNNNCTAYRQSVIDRAAGTSNNELGALLVDDSIGAILNALTVRGELDNTIFVFQQDHGQEAKDSIWEGGVRIAQFVHFPDGGFGASTFHGPVSNVDIGPTIVEYAGITGAYDMDGRSWMTAVQSDTGDWPADEEEKCVYNEIDQDRSLVCGCDKFMRIHDVTNTNAGTVSTGTKSTVTNLLPLANDMLFDLCGGTGAVVTPFTTPDNSNPEETDEYHDRPARAAQLSSLMDCYMFQTQPPPDAAASGAPDYTACVMPPQTPTVAPAPTTVPPTPSPTEVDTLGPQLLAISPAAGAHLGSVGSSYAFAAQIEEASAFNALRFDFIHEDGSEAFQIASGDTEFEFVNGMWTVDVDLIGYEGTLQWRVFAKDIWGNRLQSPYVKVFVGNAASTTVAVVRHHIEEIIAANSLAGVNLAAKFVRMGFHDCVGGCDGCIDMEDPDNAGLDVPIDALAPVVSAHENVDVSRADIWAIATLVACDVSLPEDGAVRFPLEFIGRTNCEIAIPVVDHASLCVGGTCDATSGPIRVLPSADLTTHELLDYFDTTFGFDMAETVALMGAHTLGGMSRDNSGFGDENWTTNPTVLSNAYYGDLVGGVPGDSNEDLFDEATPWDREFLDNTARGGPDRNQWTHTRNTAAGTTTKMTNADIALVRDLRGTTNNGSYPDFTSVGVDYLNSDGSATCVFTCGRKCQREGTPTCPMASQTIGQVAMYNADNDKFIDDFEAVMRKMMMAGYSEPVACVDAVCVLGEESTSRNLRGQ